MSARGGTTLDPDRPVELVEWAALKRRPMHDALVLPEQAVVLAGSAAEIVSLCETPNSPREIVTVMEAAYPHDQTVADETRRFLENLLSLGALRVAGPSVSHAAAGAR